MSTTPSEATPTKVSFERRVEDVKPSKMDINAAVMDYLINEGYPAAAKNFAAEANIQTTSGDMETIDDRVEIRNAILAGDIQTAIERINELNPDILDLNESLHFSLLRLQLVELIRVCNATPNADITPALDFASTHLAPRAPTDPEFLRHLEQTMALLIFPPDNLAPPLAELLDPSLRQSIASQVNEAILASFGYQPHPRLKYLVKLRAWSERGAREHGLALPQKFAIWSDDEVAPKSGEDSVMGGNGEEIMTS